MRFNKLSLLLIGCAMAQLVDAHEFEAGQLHIDPPWSRALPPVAPTGAAYLSISNHGDTADTLLGAKTEVAGKVEIHEHVHADGVMKMQRVESLTIEPGATVTFAPGSYHLMLFNLARPLAAGDSYPLTLQFANTGEVEVQVNVQADDEPSSAQEEHHHQLH